jgi:hypothetical protein
MSFLNGKSKPECYWRGRSLPAIRLRDWKSADDGRVIDENTGVPAAGTVSPRSQADCVGEHLPPSTVGRTEPGPDGVSIKIVAPKPGGTAAHETDGPVE